MLEFKFYGQIPLASEVRSIFDQNFAGQYATDGNYYILLHDHITHTPYAVTRETYDKAKEWGVPLMDGQIATFHGEEVRGMCSEEEEAWNIDELYCLIDFWGNISTDDKANEAYADYIYGL